MLMTHIYNRIGVAKKFSRITSKNSWNLMIWRFLPIFSYLTQYIDGYYQCSGDNGSSRDVFRLPFL